MLLLTDFIFITGIIINVVYLLFLVKTNNNHTSNKILILIFTIILFVIIDSYAILHKIKWLYALVFIIDSISLWLIAPLFYLYVKSLFSKSSSFSYKNLFHFIPALLLLIFYTIPLYVYVLFNKLVTSYVTIYMQNINLFAIVKDSYFLLYLLLTLKIYYGYKKTMKNTFSTISYNQLDWIKVLLYGSIIIICIDLSTTLYEYFYTNLTFKPRYITISATVLLLVYLSYFGINQPSISLPKSNIKKKHHLSNTSSEEIQNLTIKLESVLQNDKAYLDENLTLNTLATKVLTTDKKLSALLNKHLQTNFYDLINKYRVNAAKEKITQSTSNFIDIAFDCGFNSKSTFNRIFKKETGYSPSQYRKRK